MTQPSALARLIAGARLGPLFDSNEPSIYQAFEDYKLHIKVAKADLSSTQSMNENIKGTEEDYYFTQWSRGRQMMRELNKNKRLAVKEEKKAPAKIETGLDTVDSGVTNEAFEDSEGMSSAVSVLPDGADPDAMETETESSVELPEVVEEKVEPTRLWSGEKRMAFLIHSFGECHSAWDHTVAVFNARGYSVVAPDLIGHGFSGCPSKRKYYAFDMILENLLAVFDKQIKRFGNKAIICGHGYGAAFATAIARKRASVVELLILIDCGGPVPLAPLNHRWSKYPPLIYKILQPLVKHGMIRRNRLFSPRGKFLCHDSRNASLPQYVKSHFRKGQHWAGGDIGFHRRITQPCLLIHASKEHVTLVEMLEMERTLPRGYLEILPSADDGLLRRVIADFLDAFSLE